MMMKQYTRIAPWILLLLMVVSSGCGGRKKKVLNRFVSFSRKDKIPYGTYVAYEGLSHLFPDAEISVNTKAPGLLYNSGSKKALIVITKYLEMDGQEVADLKSFVGEGNHVFLSALGFSDTLLNSLNLDATERSSHDSLRVSVLHPVSGDSSNYIYPGDSYDRALTRIDTNFATVLGRDQTGRPNLVRYRYTGGGSLMLQFAPMAFTNFFLLHKGNHAYYERVMSYIPGNVHEVMWDEYFRLYRPSSGSPLLKFILTNKSLAAAFWLFLALIALVYLFDSKRKQRLVPEIEPLQNNSLEFVKTIGRLYYQRRDNRNLLGKMVNHFQDHIRTQYNLHGSTGEEGFVERLAYKTGVRIEFLRELLWEMHRLMAEAVVSDHEILAFDQKMEEFYKYA